MSHVVEENNNAIFVPMEDSEQPGHMPRLN